MGKVGDNTINTLQQNYNIKKRSEYSGSTSSNIYMRKNKLKQTNPTYINNYHEQRKSANPKIKQKFNSHSQANIRNLIRIASAQPRANLPEYYTNVHNK